MQVGSLILGTSLIPIFRPFGLILCRDDLAYREIIPSRAAASDLDTYQGTLRRETRQYLDIFVRVMRGSDQTGAVMICYLNDLAANLSITSPASVFFLLHC